MADLLNSPFDQLHKRLLELESQGFFGQTESAASSEPLTLEALERAVASVDPDGRRMQEARLLVACSWLTICKWRNT
jgi:hypothetical protein